MLGWPAGSAFSKIASARFKSVPSHVTRDVRQTVDAATPTDEEIRERMSGNLCRCGASSSVRRESSASSWIVLLTWILVFTSITSSQRSRLFDAATALSATDIAVGSTRAGGGPS